MLMVTEESACRIGIEDDTHEHHPLMVDHSGLVKFPIRADNRYEIVQNRLRKLVEDAPSAVKGRFSSHTGMF